MLRILPGLCQMLLSSRKLLKLVSWCLPLVSCMILRRLNCSRSFRWCSSEHCCCWSCFQTSFSSMNFAPYRDSSSYTPSNCFVKRCSSHTSPSAFRSASCFLHSPASAPPPRHPKTEMAPHTRSLCSFRKGKTSLYLVSTQNLIINKNCSTKWCRRLLTEEHKWKRN